VLLALFVFWQCFHIYDVKKTNLLKKKSYPVTLPFEVALLLIGAFAIFMSTDWLVQWFQTLESDRIPPRMLGWASGILMVLPNALLAFYYGSKDRMDVVYTSQSGDAHICIPLCIGIFASFQAIPASDFLQQSLLILMGLCAAHLLFVVTLGRLPRVFAAVFLAAFGYFLWMGI
jgi:cation:H+ antiporter